MRNLRVEYDMKEVKANDLAVGFGKISHYEYGNGRKEGKKEEGKKKWKEWNK